MCLSCFRPLSGIQLSQRYGLIYVSMIFETLDFCIIRSIDTVLQSSENNVLLHDSAGTSAIDNGIAIASNSVYPNSIVFIMIIISRHKPIE